MTVEITTATNSTIIENVVKIEGNKAEDFFNVITEESSTNFTFSEIETILGR